MIINGIEVGGGTASGTSGTSGTSGVSGTAGTSGVNGSIGSNGSSGTSGINGATGPAGTSGLSGFTSTIQTTNGATTSIASIVFGTYSTYKVNASIVAYDTSNQLSYGADLVAVFKNTGTTYSQISTTDLVEKTDFEIATSDIIISGPTMSIVVVGETGKNISWIADYTYNRVS